MKNFKTIKVEIIKIVEPILKANNLVIYEVNNYFDFESDVLQILVEDIDQPNKPLDFDDIIKSNELVSDALDELTILTEPYMLELASAGVEKPIKNQKTLIKALDSYVHVELEKSINNSNIIEGILTKYDDQNDSFQISYFLKGQKKKHIFTFSEVKNIRYAVKF